ncbi:MAG TPA: head-tail connector protein [Methanocorpusculum sp.]|nr:head-tail connector protein [Methanocorpusculum sp.]
MMKISEVTTQELADYMRLDEPTDIEISEIERMKQSAIEYIKSYTGLTDEELDLHADLAQALFIIVTDMFDNRNLYIEGKATNINKSVECILGMHSINLV